MTRFDLLKQTDIGLASRVIMELGKMFPDDSEALEKHLTTKITEDELQQLNEAARREGRSPLIFIP